MLDRALREEKPFRMKGESPKRGPDGYRDMLIWASVVERSAAYLDENDTLIVITNNHGDFCDDGDTGTVASVMRADLGRSAPTVRRLAKLDELAGELPAPPEKAAELMEMQQDLAPGGRLRDALLNAIREDSNAAVDIDFNEPALPDDYSTGLDFDEFHLPLASPKLVALDPELTTADAVVYGTDPWLDKDILARVTVRATAYVRGLPPRLSGG